MKLILSILFLVLFCKFGYGQNRNSVWCFGDSTGINFNDTANPLTFVSGMNSKGSCSSICDTVGNLLFYSSTPDIIGFWNGVYPLGIVYNRNHEMMQNGDSLNCRSWYHEMVIVPTPDDQNKYYVFHIGATGLFGLYYSIVDMTEDSGRGAVISKNNQLNSYPAMDALQAVKNGNGRDWWVLFHSPDYPDSFFIYSVDTSGVTLHHVDSMGLQATTNAGDLRFNSKGTQFAFCNWRGALAIYDFDRCTGQSSLNKIIHTEDPNGYYPYFFDVCFSPNDSLLYLSCEPSISTLDTTQQYVYQLKLWLQNPYPTRYIVYNPIYPLASLGVRLAPDNKIYIATASVYTASYPYSNTYYPIEATHLSVINEPDKFGVACDFQPFSFSLGGNRVYLEFPNNPDYDLLALGGSICDTLSYPNAIEEMTEEKWLAYPNPANSIIRFSNTKYFEFTELSLIDVTGRLVLSAENSFEIDVSGIPSGIYSALIYSGDIQISLKVSVQH
jgi:hypothetical protein